MSVGYVRFLCSELGIQFKLNCLVPNIVQLGRKEKAGGVNSKLQVSRNTVGAWEDSAIHIENLHRQTPLARQELLLSEKICETGGHLQKTCSCAPWVWFYI